MSRPLASTLLGAVLAALLAAGPAAAQAADGGGAPKVVADIAPVHGLVARVMQGVGEPALLVRPGASPHGYAMKPSEAAALEGAQAVFFVGPELTPWLTRPLATLAPRARQVELLEAPGTHRLPTRTGARFAPHHHDEEEGHDHTAAGENEDGHDPESEAGEDHVEAAGDHAPDASGGHAGDDAGDHAADTGHDHASAEADDHDHGGIDPHAWLDPENGKVWLEAIAAELAALDPAHAEAYAANAAGGAAEIDAAATEAQARLAPLAGLRFIVFHDAYQYFEERFGLHAAGAISLSDASVPGPARLATLRAMVAEEGVTCALAEPQFDPDMIATVAGEGRVRTGLVDPVGMAIPPGPGFYPALMRALAEGFAACG